jgi:ATP-dependent helicase HrpB
MLLTLRAVGLPVDSLAFLDPPLPAAVEAAEQLLARLGAVAGARGAITPLGEQLARLPVHPRLGRLLCAGREHGVGDDAAAAAALLSERDIRLAQRSLTAGPPRAADVSAPSDVVHLIELLDLAREGRVSRGALAREGLDADAVQAVEKARRQLSRLSGGPQAPRPRSQPARELAVQKALLSAYPDRVARRRPRPPGEAPEFVLATGGSAVLSPSSVARDVDLAVLIDVEDRSAAGGRGGRVVVRTASAIEADWLLDLPGDRVHEMTEALWNPTAERVEVVRRLQYEQLVLDETRTPGDGRDAAQVELLAASARAASLSVFSDSEAYPSWEARLAFLRDHCPELGVAPPTAAEREAALRALCADRHSFAELRRASLISAVSAQLEAAAQQRGAPWKGGLEALVARLCPEHVVLGHGRRVRVQYVAGQPPWIESRLQDFFGMTESPRIAGGRVPVVLHLLAPNHRAVQVTTDLAGFWTRHYPAIRKELARRYPRHAWPAEPTSA